MKLFNKYFLIAAVASLSLVACSDDDDNDSVEYATGQGYYFSADASSSIELSSTESSFDVDVYRSVSGTAATAAIDVTDESGLFSIPTSVSFAADETKQTITIGYDPDEIEYNSYEITLSLEGTGETTPYGRSEYTFTVGIPEPWVSLGYASFNDDFFFDNYYSVEVQQNQVSPNNFRLVAPYYDSMTAEGNDMDESSASTYLTFQILEVGDMVYDTTVTQEDLVYFNGYDTGWYYEYYGANVYIYHPSAFSSYQDESYWTHNAVLSYQDNGLPAVVQLAPFYYMSGVGGWNYSSYDGMVTIVFPGAELKDYSAEVSYNGRYVDVSDASYAIASVTLGDDVESARVALISADDDVDAAIEAIIAGTADYTEITEDGNVTFSCDESGKYVFVVVTYADGEAQESATATFTYTVGAVETWTAYAVGDYTYYYFWEGDDEGLTLYQSDDDPTRWKIEHWGYDVDFYFTYDESTGEVVVDDQETGYTHSSYGMVYVDDLVDYAGDDSYGESYYSDGVFYFNVIYYVSAGYFDYGYETFTLTGSAAKGMTTGAAKVNKKRSDVEFGLAPKAHHWLKKPTAATLMAN